VRDSRNVRAGHPLVSYVLMVDETSLRPRRHECATRKDSRRASIDGFFGWAIDLSQTLPLILPLMVAASSLAHATTAAERVLDCVAPTFLRRPIRRAVIHAAGPQEIHLPAVLTRRLVVTTAEFFIIHDHNAAGR